MGERNGAPRMLNAIMLALVRRGVSPMGAQELTVTGRRSGRPRTAPVNPLRYGGRLYLVSARGETQWVRNVRVHPEVRLRMGRRSTAYRVVEVDDEVRVPVLQAYLRKWRWEVGAFFPGLTADSPAAEVAAVADRHPVFRLERPDGTVGDAADVTSGVGRR